MTDIDLDALEAVAQKATPGPWRAAEDGDGFTYVDLGPGTLTVITEAPPTNRNRGADAEHIATFDPPTVRALIARLREAEAVIEKVRAVVEPPKPFVLGKSMMRSFDQMIGDLRRTLATYKQPGGGDAGAIGTGNSPSPTGQQAPASGDGMEEPSTPPRSTPRHHHPTNQEGEKA